MKKRINSVIAKIFVFVMVLQNAFPLSVSAEPAAGSGILGEISTIITDDSYTGKDIAIFTEDGAAVRVNNASGVIKVNGVVEPSENGVATTINSVFRLDVGTEGYYNFNNYEVEGGAHFVVEGTAASWQIPAAVVTYRTGNTDATGSDAWEAFVITKDEEDSSAHYIASTRAKEEYFKVNDEGNLERTANMAEATKFYFAPVVEATEDAGDPVPKGAFSIEHVASGMLVKTYGNGNDLTVDGVDGEKGTIFAKAVFGTSDDYQTASLISHDYGNGVGSVFWSAEANGAAATTVKSNEKTDGSGWETIRIVANGDGTVSFKDSYFDKYITVVTVEEKAVLQCNYDGEITNNEKFYINYVDTTVVPEAVISLAVAVTTDTTIDLTWEMPKSIYTGIQVWQKGPSDFNYAMVATLGSETSYQAADLQKGSEYSFKLVVINDDVSSESNVVTAKTKTGVTPATPTGLEIAEVEGNKIAISWDAAESATHYQVMRAPSIFGTYDVIATIPSSETGIEVEYANGDKYANYYRIVAVNNGTNQDVFTEDTIYSAESRYISLETEMFGDHTLIFAETDDMTKIDEVLQQIFENAHDRNADAQFKGEHWQIYFKPGDYSETSCINLGFYTAINGLGETPYDVKLNNVAVPAYLDSDNVTCNFWRSIENISIIKTGNAQGNAANSFRGDWFNWGVSQAAPLRRVYSERPVAYDWNYGWASGGYVADSYFVGTDDGGNSAGTWSGQQFYTRNTEMTGNAFGTTINNFLQGVVAPNLPDAEAVEAGTASALFGGNGYSDWSIPTAEGGQQFVTSIETTPKIAEKPFLYVDENGEYKVFVPAVRENTKGISWLEDDMGEGIPLLLDTFFIAKPSDTAATINAQLEEGKNIYFTPGIYHAEEVIMVNNPDTVILGSGLATIIPDNEDAAMRVADVDGVRIAGIIFDAGEASEYLLVVGEQGADEEHSDNPTILQDLFFRVGGTTDVLTKADNALEINSNNVIGDHFWIWRADHGAGVEWYGNESAHGLIVNGDGVTCYALFNEHFQEYHTLWNGENGATYFYQNETCYDPISQEAWMSHDGTVNGYASYKVADDVKKHYAVGLDIYNVFINTGEDRDSMTVQIQLDNAIEVPDTEDVLIENACLQTFANGDGALQKINSIVNGMGDPVSSGKDTVTGEVGTGWDRTFLSYYCNGKAEGSSRDVKKACNDLQKTYDEVNNQLASITDEEHKAVLEDALEAAKAVLDETGIYVVWPIEETISSLEDAATNLEAAVDAKEEAKKALTDKLAVVADLSEADYTSDSWTVLQNAVEAAEGVLADEAAALADIEQALTDLQSAQDNLVEVEKNVVNPFGDVTEEDWFYPYVIFAYKYSLMGGKGQMPDGTLKFDPTNTITRAEFVQILYAKENFPTVEYKDTFDDVPDEKWFTDAILWAASEEIVGGKSATFFDVNGKITRQEIALILYKYALYKEYDVSEATDADLSGFADAASVSNWAENGMKWAVEYNVIGGKTEKGQTVLSPGGNAIRAEAATMMKAFMGAYEAR